MGADTANKPLKLIEEPYEGTLFIMVSDQPSLILPTIYSRLQRIEARRLSDDTVARYLEERHSIDPAEALMLAHNAEVTRLTRLAYQRKIADLRGLAAELAALGREKEIKFYDYCARLVRENFVANFHVDRLNYMNREEQQFGVNFAAVP